MLYKLGEKVTLVARISSQHPQFPPETQFIMAPSYQQLAAQKLADQLSLIPPEWRLDSIPSIESAPNALAHIRRILTPTELSLTEETDITILLQKLHSRQLSSLELTKAFAKRAALAHQLTTCCTEIFFEEAFETANRLDEYLAATGRTVGALHGLPVSIKDLFAVKGVDTSIGRNYPCPDSPCCRLCYPSETKRLTKPTSQAGSG